MMEGPAAPLVLPLLAAVLLLISGAVKLRAGKRAHLGNHLPSVLELFVGAGLALLVVRGGIAPRVGLGLSIAGGLLAVASSIHLARGLSAQRSFRRRTEGHRLAAYLRQGSNAGAEEG